MTRFNFNPHEIENKTFLVVDDFGDMRGMLRSMLTSIGVGEIDTAINGREAVEALEQKHYDIVLCDYHLGPGKNGQHVLEEARFRQLIGLDAVFVMITAENTREMVMGAVEYEPDSYLTKPFTKDLLKARLEKLVIKRQDLREVELAVSAREYEKAVRMLDEKIAGRPKNLGELTKQKAEILYSAGEYEQASAVYEQILAVREMPWAKLGLGKIFYATGRLQEAVSMFEGLLQDNQRLIAAYDWLARTLRAQSRGVEAQDVLQRAVALSPKAILRQKALGELAAVNGDNKAAEHALTQAVKLGHNSVYKAPENYANLARAKLRCGNGREGLKILNNMEKEFKGADKSSLHAAMVKGIIHKDLGDREEAEVWMRQASELYQGLGPHVTADLTLDMARSYGELGDQEKAQSMLKNAVRNNHSDPELLQKVEGLIGELSLNLDPKSFVSGIRKQIIKLNNRGVKMAKAGQLQEAVELFSEAVDAMPGNKVVSLNTARVMIMNIREQGANREQLGKVRELLERVQKADPNDPALRKVQAMYQDLGQRA
ncbi:MAG: response regulator [Gammaproteobacteria bacterium]|nr:response regulator [Gammaproteobacteria bacterium]